MNSREGFFKNIYQNNIDEIKEFTKKFNELKKENKETEDFINEIFIFNGIQVTSLILSTINDSAEMIALLVDAGAKIDMSTENYYAPVLIAAATGKNKALSQLIALGAQTTLDGISATIAATEQNQVESLRILHQANVDLNERSPDGIPPVFLAALNPNPDMLNTLIELKVDINKTCRENNSSPIFLAANEALDVNCELLIKAQADLNVCIKRNDSFDGETALIAAVRAYSLCDLDEIEKKSRYLSIIKMLINSQRADLNIQRCSDGATAIFIAAADDNLEVFNILLNAGANINIPWEGPNGDELLEDYVVRLNKSSIITSLENFDLTRIPTLDWFITIIAYNKTEKLRNFIDKYKMMENKGDNDIFNLVFSLNDKQITPLIFSIKNDNPEMIALLANAGAKINMKTKDTAAPLFVAVASGKCKALSQLIALGAHKTLHGISAVHVAVAYNQIESLRILHQANADLDEYDRGGQPPMFVAALNPNNVMLNTLIELKADINKPRWRDNATPIFAAVDKNLLKNCAALVAAQADLNIRLKTNDSNDGETVLHMAVRAHSLCKPNEMEKKFDIFAIINLIVSSKRADLNIQRSDGETAIMLAGANNNYKVCNILLAAGAITDKICKASISASNPVFGAKSGIKKSNLALIKPLLVHSIINNNNTHSSESIQDKVIKSLSNFSNMVEKLETISSFKNKQEHVGNIVHLAWHAINLSMLFNAILESPNFYKEKSDEKVKLYGKPLAETFKSIVGKREEWLINIKNDLEKLIKKSNDMSAELKGKVCSAAKDILSSVNYLLSFECLEELKSIYVGSSKPLVAKR